MIRPAPTADLMQARRDRRDRLHEDREIAQRRYEDAHAELVAESLRLVPMLADVLPEADRDRWLRLDAAKREAAEALDAAAHAWWEATA